MPKIEITETFLDTSTSTQIDNAVVVPYLTTKASEVGKVYYCKTLSEFADYIGSSSSENGFVYVSADGTVGGGYGYQFVTADSERPLVKAMPDRGYLLASTLLSAGYYVAAIPVNVAATTKYTNVFQHKDITAVTYAEAVRAINGAYVQYNSSKPVTYKQSSVAELLKNKKTMPIRFLTTGGYPNIDVAPIYGGWLTAQAYQDMNTIANDRGDAVALIDLPEDITWKNSEGTIVTDKGIVGYCSHLKSPLYPDYAQCVYPYGEVTFSWQDNEVLTSLNAQTSGTYSANCMMPGSYFYLVKMLSCIKGEGSWISPAGLTRGVIGGSSMNLSYYITEAECNILDGTTDGGNMSPAFLISCILPFANYGTVLWGNRTCTKITNGAKSYENFMNVRNLLCDIKKQIYNACLQETFEPNDDIAWGEFKTKCNTLLDKMKSGRGIKLYQWERQSTTTKGLLKANLTIVPIEALEDFEINIDVTDDAGTVEIAEG